MVLSQRAGIPVVDLYREGVEKFSGVIPLYFENGKIVRTEKIPNPAPIVIDGKVTLKASEAPDTASVKANGGKK